MTYISGLLIVALLSQAPSETVKKKLDRACETVADRDHPDRKFIERELDLGSPEVSAYMVSKMNVLPARGETASPRDVMRQLIQAHPGKTVEWLLDHYEEFSPAGLKNLADALRHLENRECYQLLLAMMRDRRVVVDEYAARISPPPYYPDRVCDAAYEAISWILYKQKKLPSGLPSVFGSSNSFEQRDKAIKRLTDWWATESEMILMQAEPLTVTRPSLQFKVESVMQRPTPKADSKK